MKKAITVIINASGGTAASKGESLKTELESAFGEAGLQIDLHLVKGEEIESAVKATRDKLVVIGGGDGTLGGAAGLLAERGATLGVLPLGTRNHLARELGIPLDIPGAVQVIAAGKRRKVDLARVNGRAFVNNASVGFYPDLVNRRDDMALPKKLAALPATFAALKRMRHHRLRLRRPGGDDQIVTPMLFVGNNRYSLDRGRLGQREALDDGLLSIYAVASRRRMALIGFALRTLIGGADKRNDFAAIGDAAELKVTGRSSRIDIALDGEVLELRMPLEFTIDAGGLSVLAPA